MIKARYQKMYTEKYKQDMDFVIIGDHYLGPFIDMNVAQKAVRAINNLYNQLSPKPRTEIVYEKVTESIFDLKEEFESGGLYWWYESDCKDKSEYINISSEYDLMTYAKDGGLFREVEKEIDWREELNKWQHTEKIGIYTPLDFEVSTLIKTDPDKFLEMCRVALRATGELE